MDVEMNIDKTELAYLLCSAFEGGVGYWCRIMDTVEPEEAAESELNDFPSYCSFPLEGGAVVCRRDEEETDSKYTPLVLNEESIRKGLSIFATKYPHHFADFIDGNFDALTGDVFVQCCLLGDCEYG